VQKLKTTASSAWQDDISQKGFDIVLVLGPNNSAEDEAARIFHEVILTDPALRDASVLVVGANYPHSFKPGNTYYCGNIAPQFLPLLGSVIILPTDASGWFQSYWTLTAAVASAARVPLLTYSLGEFLPGVAETDLPRNKRAWRDAIWNSINMGGGSDAATHVRHAEILTLMQGALETSKSKTARWLVDVANNPAPDLASQFALGRALHEAIAGGWNDDKATAGQIMDVNISDQLLIATLDELCEYRAPAQAAKLFPNLDLNNLKQIRHLFSHQFEETT
jgi:hypothetical protein